MFHEFSKVLGPSDRSRIVKKCQELVTEVAKKYQDINFGTLLVQIRIVGQGPQAQLASSDCDYHKFMTKYYFFYD